MANDDPVKAAGPSAQISTTDPAVLAAPAARVNLSPQPPTAQAAAQQAAPGAAPQAPPDAQATPNQGVGMEGEFDVWDGHYSLKNFMGRCFFRVVLTIAWIALAVRAWDEAPTDANRMVRIVATLTGVVLLAYWLYLVWQVLAARLSHHYRLTNRRLFISTGIFHRRRDQVELLNVKDLYVKQPGLFYRWLGVGTVVVESSEQKLPITYLAGVDDPKTVMDTIWHCARAEREGSAVQVDRI
jgi:membrane protein YdbS with pleckstrin-like domain